LYPQIVLTNGYVITLDEKGTIAESVAIQDNKILRVGTNRETRGLVGPGTKVIDLDGRALVPGLTDPHLHLIGAGLAALREFRIPSTSVADVLERVREMASKKRRGEWLIGGDVRFAHLKFRERRLPTRWELDEAAPENPVFLRMGPHIKVVNSPALESSGITMETSDPLGGTIVRDDNGDPTGVLRETAGRLVSRRFPPYSFDDMLAAIRLEADRCLEAGITTIHDIVVSPEEVKAYMTLRQRGELGVRVVLLVRVWESEIELDHLLNMGLMSGFGDNWLKVGGVKMSVGGGISGSNAAFYEEYCDEPGNFGVIRIPYPDLVSLIRRAHAGGLQCAVHALGDRDLDMVINAFKAALKGSSHGFRHRVEHAGNWCFTPERRAAFRELGLNPVPNINFLYTFGDAVQVTLGPGRVSEHFFPLKTMREEGFLLVSGSDGPDLEPADPLRDIATAMQRRTEKGVEMSPEEALGFTEALEMFTCNSAYLASEEDNKGSIEKGKLADLVVLDRDPLTLGPENVRDLKVDYTIIDGKIMYARELG
jgi:predicted amidohydrolase YtcJ